MFTYSYAFELTYMPSLELQLRMSSLLFDTNATKTELTKMCILGLGKRVSLGDPEDSEDRGIHRQFRSLNTVST